VFRDVRGRKRERSLKRQAITAGARRSVGKGVPRKISSAKGTNVLFKDREQVGRKEGEGREALRKGEEGLGRGKNIPRGKGESASGGKIKDKVIEPKRLKKIRKLTSQKLGRQAFQRE